MSDVPANVGLLPTPDIDAVNIATLTYLTTDITPVTVTVDDEAQTDMVEPQLTMTKSNNIVALIDAGATVTYTHNAGPHRAEYHSPRSTL
ncbi:MAG: hypothetical protein IPK52_27380 [Chloroflexi bacterium]|nr:hypothetical protein [Chloroflexota bacterium]